MCWSWGWKLATVDPHIQIVLVPDTSELSEEHSPSHFGLHLQSRFVLTPSTFFSIQKVNSKLLRERAYDAAI
jgi:hypothetical protein